MSREEQGISEPAELPVKLTQDLLNIMPSPASANEGRYAYVREGKHYSELLDDDKDRHNQLTINTSTGSAWTFYDGPIPEPATEEEALQNLHEFLETATQTLSEQPNQDRYAHIADAIKTLREEMVFVGEVELAEAISAIAEYWDELIQSGSEVYLYTPTGIGKGYRSNFYLTLRATEEFMKRTKGRVSDRKHLHIAQNGSALATEIGRAVQSRKTEDYKVIFFDDFSISGSQLQELLPDLNTPYRNAYIKDHFEVNLVAGGDTPVEFSPTSTYQENSMGEVRETNDSAFRKVVYYNVPGNPLPIVTGSHSSTDNSFEMPIKSIQHFLRSQEQAYTKFLPVFLRRPYDYNELEYHYDGNKYPSFDDPTLLGRWRDVLDEFGLEKIEDKQS